MASLHVNCRLYGTVMRRNGGIQKNLKSNTQSADSNLRPRCKGSSETKDLPTLAPRDECRNETRTTTDVFSLQLPEDVCILMKSRTGIIEYLMPTQEHGHYT
ncbi:hypothetical protein AVEN_9274-1 [Araneus ventricosus]|uniref:Uncharacterized protein n=1 Tax=Araneus ventricosus TaxID=182803 RepID=A0A4Y2JTG3_ARAVE|nr:hypothetical protein AVEN_9274-1 [Araneus ventricosus]